MKIIHCADIHLDSSLKTNLDPIKAKSRKNELIATFERMVSYAAKNGVDAIIIAGDLFDSKNVSVKTKGIIKKCIEENHSIDFLYLKGNHDSLSELYDENAPLNLKLFGTEWTSYRYDNIVITGIELGGDNIYNSLMLKSDDINIVVMHGQEADYVGKDKTEVVSISSLKDKYIDYLALGHVHTYKDGNIDKRGKWCYSGCLEGRGFDECGDKGFVLVETNGNKISHKFIQFDGRKATNVTVDISSVEDTATLDRTIYDAIKEIDKACLVKVSLVGSIGVDTRYDLDYVQDKYESEFYAFRVDDDLVKLKIDIESYMHDISLKGEFIRHVFSGDYTDAEKKAIVDMGMKALFDEEV